ncbi:MAG: hypothetical protein HQK52_12500 [Oligoflexia bacterium]|nr:hypothetical protein [Oligoflexia bacterium]
MLNITLHLKECKKKFFYILPMAMILLLSLQTIFAQDFSSFNMDTFSAILRIGNCNQDTDECRLFNKFNSNRCSGCTPLEKMEYAGFINYKQGLPCDEIPIAQLCPKLQQIDQNRPLLLRAAKMVSDTITSISQQNLQLGCVDLTNAKMDFCKNMLKEQLEGKDEEGKDIKVSYQNYILNSILQKKLEKMVDESVGNDITNGQNLVFFLDALTDGNGDFSFAQRYLAMVKEMFPGMNLTLITDLPKEEGSAERKSYQNAIAKFFDEKNGVKVIDQTQMTNQENQAIMRDHVRLGGPAMPGDSSKDKNIDQALRNHEITSNYSSERLLEYGFSRSINSQGQNFFFTNTRVFGLGSHDLGIINPGHASAAKSFNDIQNKFVQNQLSGKSYYFGYAGQSRSNVLFTHSVAELEKGKDTDTYLVLQYHRDIEPKSLLDQATLATKDHFLNGSKYLKKYNATEEIDKEALVAAGYSKIRFMNGKPGSLEEVQELSPKPGKTLHIINPFSAGLGSEDFSILRENGNPSAMLLTGNQSVGEGLMADDETPLLYETREHTMAFYKQVSELAQREMKLKADDPFVQNLRNLGVYSNKMEEPIAEDLAVRAKNIAAFAQNPENRTKIRNLKKIIISKYDSKENLRRMIKKLVFLKKNPAFNEKLKNLQNEIFSYCNNDAHPPPSCLPLEERINRISSLIAPSSLCGE